VHPSAVEFRGHTTNSRGQGMHGVQAIEDGSHVPDAPAYRQVAEQIG
jgi:hypothetical protein